jgi:hemoglobin-like flavoprotein
MSTLRLAQHAGYIFIVRTAMTPIQIELVQESFRRLGPRSSEASRLFYEELFRIAPELRGLFPEDLSRQKAKFTQMLGVLVTNLGQVSNISDDLIDLGHRHAAYDVEDENYEAVSEAFIRMMERLLGSDMTLELRDAWSAVLDMVARVMKDAANAPRSTDSFFARIVRDVMTAHYGLTIRTEGRNARASISKEIESGKVIKLS